MKEPKQTLLQDHCPDARSLAVQVLLHVKPSQPLQASLDTGLRNTSLTQKDHALCTELAYGTMRFALRLDAVLDTLMKKRSAVPQEMQVILRVAAYALLYLDRVPHHATVNWAVEIIKRRFGQSLSKVTNGTLRSIIRLEGKALERDFYAQACDYFSVPAWLYKHTVASYGQEDAERIFTRSLQRPKIGIRLNPRHKLYDALKEYFENNGKSETVEAVEGEHDTASSFTAKAVGWTGFVFEQGHCPREVLGQNTNKLHDAGAFSWQAAGSQIVLKKCFEAVPDLKFSPLWDACAGQGGKSLALLEQGLEVPLATDINKGRLMLLRETAHRLKVPCPEVVCASASSFVTQDWQGNILLDVPCSGFGTLSRRPEIRLHRSQNDMLNLVGLQKKILRASYAALAAGQYIIYMTCTLNPVENEKLLAKFLEQESGAQMVFSWQTPHDHAYLEGMYVAVIKKSA